MLISEASTNSSDSPVCKLWVTPTGLPLHLQVSWGNIFQCLKPRSKGIWVKLTTLRVREVLAGVSLETTTCKAHLQERDSCWLCAPDCQSPPLKGSTLVYQTPLHSQFSIICQLAEPALCSIVQGIEEDAKQD